MKLDGAIFAIEQRTVGGCIDLAVVFLRKHLWQILQLLAWFAVPSIVLSWWLIDQELWTLTGCVFLFFLECPFFGAALVAAAGHRVFDDPFSSRRAVQILGKRVIVFGAIMLVARMFTIGGAFLCLIPGYLIATRYGFLAEVLLLEGCPAKQYETRLSDLMNATFVGLVGRLLTVASFFSIAVVSIFVLVDMASATLFGLPILLGRITDMAYFEEELTILLTSDPRVAVVLITVMWLVYPVTRLAWMFCYFDVRIRKEGWDVELDFRVEARRLEAAS